MLCTDSKNDISQVIFLIYPPFQRDGYLPVQWSLCKFSTNSYLIIGGGVEKIDKSEVQIFSKFSILGRGVIWSDQIWSSKSFLSSP